MAFELDPSVVGERIQKFVHLRQAFLQVSGLSNIFCVYAEEHFGNELLSTFTHLLAAI